MAGLITSLVLHVVKENRNKNSLKGCNKSSVSDNLGYYRLYYSFKVEKWNLQLVLVIIFLRGQFGINCQSAFL